MMEAISIEIFRQEGEESRVVDLSIQADGSLRFGAQDSVDVVHMHDTPFLHCPNEVPRHWRQVPRSFAGIRHDTRLLHSA
jgi:hypothetical protein